jgi:peptidoglycan/xylan/chitin deacetylase (PgdA/CDA1 family)
MPKGEDFTLFFPFLARCLQSQWMLAAQRRPHGQADIMNAVGTDRQCNSNCMKLLNSYLNWKVSPPTCIAAFLCIAACAITLWRMDLWPWAAGAVALSQAYLTLAGLWPRSRILGSNWISLPAPAAARGEVAITIDDGPDPEVTPQVLDILDRYQAKATFFCVGERAAQYAPLCGEIVRRGHAVENHTQHHSPLFAFLGPGRALREIAAAQDTLCAITGQAPAFFRPPAGLRSPILHPVLVHLGLQLAAWTRRGFDTRERSPERVLERLSQGLQAGDILLLHDGHAARTASGEPVILAVLPRLLERLARAGLQPVTLRAART